METTIGLIKLKEKKMGDISSRLNVLIRLFIDPQNVKNELDPFPDLKSRHPEFIEKHEKLFKTSFLGKKDSMECAIYNEFSLQHELGIFLRKELEPFGFKVQFERNIENFFQIPANLSGKERTDWIKAEQKKFCKHEMDILIFKTFDLDSEKYAIELKYPKNGQYPEQMYSFIKDIKFMEQVNEKFNIKTFVLTLVDDKTYYMKTGKEKDKSIYWYFRSENDTEKSETITAKQDIEKNTTIQKPTGNKAKNDNESDEKWLEIKLDNSYKKVEWKSILNSDLKNYRYYFFEIPPKKK